MKIEVSHIVVNGCSLTHCQGLEDPKTNGWPALLAKKFGLPIVNIAARGSSNEGILRRTYDYFYKDFKNNKPFYIIGWTGAMRKEEYIDIKGHFSPISLNDPSTPLEKYLVNQMSSRGIALYEFKKLIHWSSCINLFKANGVPYIMTDFVSCTITEKESLEKEYPEIFNFVHKDPYKIQDMLSYTNSIKGNHYLPCGHYNLNANKLIADFIYDNICDRYDVKPIVSDYTSSKDYISEPDISDKNIWA